MTKQMHHCSLQVQGLHCRSCELTLEQALRQLPGVTDVDVSAADGVAQLRGTKPIDRAAVARVVAAEGYGAGVEAVAHPKLLQLAVAFALSTLLLWLLSRVHILGFAPSAAAGLTLFGSFTIGIVAGMSSCLAVVGGFVLALSSRLSTQDRPPMQRLFPLLQFNVGRLVGYFLLGALVGLIGQSFSFGPLATAILTLAVAGLMLWIGLSLLGVPLTLPRSIVPKSALRWIAGLSESDHPAAPTLLGALTFFLPCGFTQSVQLVALATGDPMQSGLLLFAFALGTLPSLLFVSLAATVQGRGVRQWFQLTAGALVVLLALLNVQSSLALLGVPLPTSFSSMQLVMAPQAVPGGLQEVSMVVSPYGSYEPDGFIVQAGSPVRWHIDGTHAEGCTSNLVVPSLGIERQLEAGDNVIEFTPTAPGTIAFSCGMGMVRGSFKVI
jgi:uncharacterized protein